MPTATSTLAQYRYRELLSELFSPIGCCRRPLHETFGQEYLEESLKSADISNRTSRKTTASQGPFSGTTRATLPSVDLTEILSHVEPTSSPDQLHLHVPVLCGYLDNYEISFSDGMRIYRNVKIMMDTNEAVKCELAYTILHSLLKTQVVPHELKLDAFRYFDTLNQTFHKLKRPDLLFELLEGGRNIDGLEHTILNDVTKVAAECFQMLLKFESGLLRDEHDETPRIGGLRLNTGVLRHSYHRSLSLVASVVKFGPSLMTDKVSGLIEQTYRFIATAEQPSEDDLVEILRVYDALITRAEIPHDLLPSVVKALCRLQGQGTKHDRQKVIDKTQQTFEWLFNTHLQSRVTSELTATVSFRYRNVDLNSQEADGALQLLLVVLEDPNYGSSINIDLDDLLLGFGEADHEIDQVSLLNELLILQALVEKEHLQQKLVSELEWENVAAAIRNLSARIKLDGEEVHTQDRKRLYEILSRLDTLPDLTSSQRDVLRSLFLELSPDIPFSIADKFLKTYERPLSSTIYDREVMLVKQSFLDTAGIPNNLRLLAAEVLQSTCLEAQQRDPAQGRRFASLILDALEMHEPDLVLQERLVDYALQYRAHLTDEEDDLGFFAEMDTKMTKAAQRPSQQVSASTGAGHSTSTRHITSALVVLFMRTINISVRRSQMLYKFMLELLVSPHLTPSATVMLLRGFFRMRSDVHHHVFLAISPEGEGMAAALYRSGQSSLRDPRRASRASSLSETGPVWMYGEIRGLPEDPPESVSLILYSQKPTNGDSASTLDVSAWLRHAISIIERGADWEVYSYVIVHLGAQLTNQTLFTDAVPLIRDLRTLVCRLLLKQSFQRPPEASDLKQADVAVCFYHILTMLIGYHEHFSRHEIEETISAFIMGMTAWDRTTVHCVHALTLCCYELPEALMRDLARIIGQMSTIVTKQDAAVHVLEFLVGLSRLKDLARTFRGDEIKTVFGVCFSYIEYVRGKRFDDAQQQRRSTPVMRPSSAQTETLNARYTAADIPQYVFALAYHVIIFWYITMRETDRSLYFPWVQGRLLSTDQAGNQEDWALVTLDLIWRTTKRNITSTSLIRPEPTSDESRIWTSPYSLISITLNTSKSSAVIVERRASGTDGWSIPVDQSSTPESVFDQHLLHSTDVPIPNGWNPSPLVESDSAKRAINMLDRVSPVDFYKAGVIYIGEDQTTESDILANLMGSADYRLMLSGLGTPLSLSSLQHNTCGLDTSPASTDGRKTLWHRDEVTALIYHIATMMPTDLANDPHCTRKKAHIGNDHVNIVFNNSGSATDFATLSSLLPSAFNYVYIVVSPEARATFIETRTRQVESGWFAKSWFRVQVLTRQDFPNISSAAETKVVSGQVLATYVRNLALNACIFANVWANREGGEYPSSWRGRLMQLRMLKERFGEKSR